MISEAIATILSILLMTTPQDKPSPNRVLEDAPKIQYEERLHRDYMIEEEPSEPSDVIYNILNK